MSHGTTSTYGAGCRCEPCTRARMRYEKRRRVALARAGAPQSDRGRWLIGRVYTRPLVGVERRLRGLARMGYRAADIGAETGINPTQLHRYMGGVGDAVFVGTHDAIVEAYDRLCMTPGPSAVARRRAEAKGWAPPLAWDDNTIDNPNAEPDFGEHEKGYATRKLPDTDVLVAEVNRSGVRIVAERHGAKPKTVQRALRRAGYRAVIDGQGQNLPTYIREAAA